MDGWMGCYYLVCKPVCHYLMPTQAVVRDWSKVALDAGHKPATANHEVASSVVVVDVSLETGMQMVSLPLTPHTGCRPGRREGQPLDDWCVSGHEEDFRNS